ncbi:UNKNOWN [Stylonychia lemnae]|uniref:Uncharacterized protein n=1 Tax=Stylonychia lemnae TaxID=5949 RepID=A0A078A2N5_STYLE|nr:UNKNOWN [Stylonychia lemnae]|eukprot:CDW76087.1 UNKNOWN [Stylonychia lemnae]
MYAQSFVDHSKRISNKHNNQNQLQSPRKNGVGERYLDQASETKKYFDKLISQLQIYRSMSTSRVGAGQTTYDLRRFGQYQGPQMGPLYDQQSAVNQSLEFGKGNPALQTFASGFSGAMSQGSQSVGRRTRCSDRFVKYPYPKTMITNYQKEYHQKNEKSILIPQKETFNPEKEHKIINPHKMELSTTNKVAYQPFAVQPQRKSMQRAPKSDAPAQQQSSYMAGFPNWNNGHQDVYHEKHPQYPYYSLPFKGSSSYQNSFTEEQMRQLRKHQEMIASLGKTSSVNHYQPHQFDFETTNQSEYKPFRLANRPITQKPVVEPVRTKAFPLHFETQNKKEFVQHQIRVPEIDLIQYP